MTFTNKASAVLILLVTSWAVADERPNIVVFLCDDLGYGDLECYGHPHVKLTGRSPNRAGVYDWIPPGNKARTDAREQVHMGRDEVTIAPLLKAAGYRTCMAGKWHCNSRFNTKAQPQPGDFGFDHWLATQNNAAPSHENPNNFVRNGKPVGEMEGYSCQIVVDETVNWLKQSPDSDQPFFIFMPFHETHEPVASPKVLVDQYRDVSRNEDEAQYFANIANVDNAVGRFVDELEAMNLRKNTLVIFTSDNGPETLKRYQRAKRSYGQPGKLRGMKLHTTDAGFRVAGIMNWPERIAAGQVSSTVVSALDFMPTFCQLAKTSPPASVALDGTNLLPALNGDPLQREKPLVWAYYNATNDHRVAMRDGNWKVLAKINGGALPMMQNVTDRTREQVVNAELTDIEVYDVSTDMGESRNIASDDADLAKRLGDKLKKHYRELATNSRIWTVQESAK
jgi:arylsulfatase A